MSSRTFSSNAYPQRVHAAQVLDRPERQLVVAGWLPLGTSGTTTQTARVEVVDYATGSVLWQSALLPSYDGAPLSKLEVADVDADGRLELVVAYGENVAVLTPAAGTGVVASYAAQTFSLLDRGAGNAARLATLRNTDVAFYDGLAAAPEKTFVLPYQELSIALFARDDALMFATGNHTGLTLRRYSDGEVIAVSGPQTNRSFASLAAISADGGQHVDIVGSNPGFFVWRIESEYVFRNGFD